MADIPANPATVALEALDVPYEIAVHGPVKSLAEAAAVRGVAPRQVIKTIVVRVEEGRYVLVLVPGDRQISWPKLRTHIGVNRLSLPDARLALEATGYERGAITPFGALPSPDGSAWPVIADQLIVDRQEPVSIGAGDHGVSATLAPRHLLEATSAQVVDVTDPL